MSRLAVLVHPEERDIKVVPRISEVIGISAEEGHIKLWSEYQPHIGVFFVFVEVINLARVEDHHVATQSLGTGGTLLFHLRHGGALGLPSISRRHTLLHAGIDLVRYILD